MGATFQPKYPAAGKALTLTLTSLGSSATDGRESTLVDNTTNRHATGRIHVKTKTGAGTIANDQCMYLYAYEETLDEAGNPTLPTNVTGTDAAVAAIQAGNLRYLGAIDLKAQNTSYEKDFDLAAAFPTGLPRKWGVIARNYCGVALSATAGDHKVTFYGQSFEAVT